MNQSRRSTFCVFCFLSFSFHFLIVSDDKMFLSVEKQFWFTIRCWFLSSVACISFPFHLLYFLAQGRIILLNMLQKCILLLLPFKKFRRGKKIESFRNASSNHNRNRFVCLLLFFSSFLLFPFFFVELTNYSMKIYFDLEITQRDIIIVPWHYYVLRIFFVFFCDCILSYYLVKTDEFDAREFNERFFFFKKSKRREKENQMRFLLL